MVTVLTVTDLYQDRRLYEELAKVVRHHRMDLGTLRPILRMGNGLPVWKTGLPQENRAVPTN